MTAATTSVASLFGRALSGSIALDAHPTDDRIIDAAVEELSATPLRKLALEDVARRAGVARMTVYRRFGNRQRLIEATIARETARFLAAVAAADDPGAPAVDRVSTAFATALTEAHRHPLVAYRLAADPGEVLAVVLADDGHVLRAGSRFIAAGIGPMGAAAKRPHIDPQRLGDLLVRLFTALVLMAPPAIDLTDPQQALGLARELIAPMVLGAIG